MDELRNRILQLPEDDRLCLLEEVCCSFALLQCNDCWAMMKQSDAWVVTLHEEYVDGITTTWCEECRFNHYVQPHKLTAYSRPNRPNPYTDVPFKHIILNWKAFALDGVTEPARRLIKYYWVFTDKVGSGVCLVLYSP